MNVRIPIPSGGEMPGYMALPARPSAGVVVVQEIFGVTQNMKSVCDWLASRQIAALCPEIFWRTDPGLVLEDYNVEKARAARARVNDDTACDDIAAAMEFLKRHEMVNAGVGVLGYCWGGLLAYLTAVRHKPEAAVSYYGVMIEKHLDLARNLACPIMLHYGALDNYAPPEVVAQVRDAFKDDSRVIIYEYAKGGHGFAREGSPHYHHPSADLANMRTLSFFIDRLIGRRAVMYA
jgi:carboxymethylenebutenolidase